MKEYELTTTQKIICFVFRNSDGSVKGYIKLTFEPGARVVAIREFINQYTNSGGERVNEKKYNKIAREFEAAQLIKSKEIKE